MEIASHVNASYWQLDGQNAYMTGKLKTKGNMMFATKLAAVLKVRRSMHAYASSAEWGAAGHESSGEAVIYLVTSYNLHTTRMASWNIPHISMDIFSDAENGTTYEIRYRTDAKWGL